MTERPVRLTPSWCTKPKPCDYEPARHYCPHLECRQALEKGLNDMFEQALTEARIRERDWRMLRWAIDGGYIADALIRSESHRNHVYDRYLKAHPDEA